MRPIQETIFESPADYPIKLTWRSGPPFKPPILAYHNELECHFIRQGRGTYSINGELFPFVKNTVLWIRSGEIHLFVPDPAIYTIKAMLQLTISCLDKAEKILVQAMPRCLLLSDLEATHVEILLYALDEEIRVHAKHWRELVGLHVRSLLLLLDRATASERPGKAEHPLIGQIAAHVETTFSGAANVQAIARHFGFSTSHLEHVFKREMGLGLKEYILQRRVLEAKKILENKPSWKVLAVAQAVGFDEFCAFNRAFKKRVGMTPAAYRRIVHMVGRKRYTAQ